jgi:hypothetical protein
MADFSHDQSVKNLIKDYPAEALEFLAGDVVAEHGRPVEFEFLDTAVAKDDTAEPGPGKAMDLAIRYVFADGHGVLFVLVECPIRRKRPVDSEQSGRVPWPSERLQGTR